MTAKITKTVVENARPDSKLWDMQIPGFDEFKIRASYGTAGGRPRFSAQYETYSVSGGQVSPIALGVTMYALYEGTTFVIARTGR